MFFAFLTSAMVAQVAANDARLPEWVEASPGDTSLFKRPRVQRELGLTPAVVEKVLAIVQRKDDELRVKSIEIQGSSLSLNNKTRRASRLRSAAS